ncbi:MAG: hypothetical protein M3552_01990, partial [Planctomycetota bacterium]|nr:hypothetical protein [Planctomycetota bacterium]
MPDDACGASTRGRVAPSYRLWFVASVCSLTFTFTFTLNRSVAEEPEVDLQDVWTAFAARQQAAETAEFVWTNQFVVSKEIYRGDEDIPKPPTTDLVSEPMKCRLIYSGEVRKRIDLPVISWVHGDAGEARPSSMAYDGEFNWTFDDRSGLPGPTAGNITRRQGMFIGPTNINISPLE